ncbi:MAG: hypothetical protein H7177_14720 [Rhizobacter sp.]|nr:hypothetical protein [Bacteriovorax sp.]
MKKTILIALTLLSFQSAFAQRFPGGPGPMPGPGGRDDLPMCLKNLDNANRRYDNLQNQLTDLMRRCNQSGPVNGDLQRQNDDLRNQVAGLNGQVSSLLNQNNNLSLDNNRLQNDNMDLRRQLDDLRGGANRTLGFFSYAGCKDFSGNISLTNIAGGEGRVGLESETVAKQKVAATYSCTYGIVTGATEEIRSIQPNSYCVAGCKDFSGNVSQANIKSGTGRNATEAAYNAMKAVAGAYSCTYGIKIQACQ